ncbi:MAG: DUF6655 family protein [Phycisphaerales bacterium]
MTDLTATRRLVAALAVPVALLAMLGGCGDLRVTDPPRTATEQFLVSTAVSQAIGQLTTAPLRDRVVFVDTSYVLSSGDPLQIDDIQVLLNNQDRQFLAAELRARLLGDGVRVADSADEAEIVLEVRTGGLGVDRSDFLFGLPPFLIPATGTGDTNIGGGTLIAPELAIVKNIEQRGYASIAYVAYWRESGEIVGASGPFLGQTDRVDWWFFGSGPRTSGNIPTAGPPPAREGAEDGDGEDAKPSAGEPERTSPFDEPPDER